MLGYNDLCDALKAGDIAVSGSPEPSAFSIDVRIGRLFRRNYVKMTAIGWDVIDRMPDEQFIDECLEEVPIPEEGIQLRPLDSFLALTEEDIYLSKGLRGEITSRSSYARMGIAVRSTSDERLNQIDREDYRPVLLMLHTFTHAKIKKGEPAGQLFVYPDRQNPPRDDIVNLLNSGELVVNRNGNPIPLKEIFGDGSINLTLGEKIHVYNGGLIIPGQSVDHAFDTVQLKRTQPRLLNQGQFFISASAEYVEIPEGLVGYVTEHLVLPYCAREPSRYQTPYSLFASHANAPYLASKNIMSGTITFENTMHHDALLIPGMKLSELSLIALQSPITGVKPSRYHGQNGAQIYKAQQTDSRK